MKLNNFQFYAHAKPNQRNREIKKFKSDNLCH